MHDIRLIRDDPQAFDEGLRRRNLLPLSADLIALDNARREALAIKQSAKERVNRISKEIGQAKASGNMQRFESLMAERAGIAQSVEKAGDIAAQKRESELSALLATIPNTPNRDVPEGADETGNVVRHVVGAVPNIANPKQHFDLGHAWRTALGPAMDFDRATKLSGSRFVVLKGQLARLERALGQFMLDLHTTEHGYMEVSPPLLVRDDAMFGTAQLPKFGSDQFMVPVNDWELAEHFGFQGPSGATDIRLLFIGIGDQDEEPSPVYTFQFSSEGKWWPSDSSEVRRVLTEFEIAAAREELGRRWLIPTAEVPLTNLVRESILSEEELPLRFTALTPCFRAEAGAAGRDTRGMLRQHQFTKCELVSITTPDRSAEEHERMLACAEAVLTRLELPFRTMVLCTGDMGFASAKTYDIEVFMPGQGTYREISSCSVCTDFQARRMDARYRPADGKPRFVHTLNGSGVAVGRALIAVLENYQQPDGTVTVPSALRPYMGGLDRIGG